MRCNTRQIDKVEIENATKIPFFSKGERLSLLAEPMGEIQSYYWNDYTVTKWHLNRTRLWRLRKRVKGPVQRHSSSIKESQTRKLVYPSKKYVIKRFRNSQGKVVKIYDTNKTQTIDKVYNDYFMLNNIRDMQDVIEGGKVREEEHTDEFFKRIYEDISYHQIYHRRIDSIYD